MEDILNPCKYDFIHFLSDGVLLFSQDKILDMNMQAAALLQGDRNLFVNRPLQEFEQCLDKQLEDIWTKSKTASESFNMVYQKPASEPLELNLRMSELNPGVKMLIIKSVKGVLPMSLNEIEREVCCKMNPYIDVCGKWHKHLVEKMPMALLVAKDGRYVYVNGAAVQLLEASDTEALLGKTMEDHIIKILDERQSEHQPINKTSFVVVEAKVTTEKNRSLNIELMSSLMLYQGEELEVSIVRDITEKKKLEEEKKSLLEAVEYDKLKTEFFSNLSHELKTPLNILLGTLQLITAMHEGFSPCSHYHKFKYYFQIMRQNSYRLLRLINNLIDISKIDSGFLEMRYVKGDMVKLLEDIVDSVDSYVKMKGLELVFEKKIEMLTMAIDYDKIERIILNLISNAIKFNKPEGKIKVTVGKTENFVRITVADTGIGIPEDMKNKIFERFRQVDDLFTRRTEGSGIGLSLVKSLVEGHGGTISVESELQKGSEFIILLPITDVQNEQGFIKNNFEKQDKVERIHIEFSDIYSVS